MLKCARRKIIFPPGAYSMDGDESVHPKETEDEYMNDTRTPSGAHRENVCIDSMRILDSCRDKDCFEDARVFLTDFGQEVICKAGSVRVRSTEVLCCGILIDPVQFSRGFYQITVRFFTKVILEACICLGKSQEIEGVCVCEKKVVLYGSEGNVRVFRSDNGVGDFCAPCRPYEEGSNQPSVVVECVDPIALNCKIKDKCPCSCPISPEELPENVCGCVNGTLSDYSPSGKYLYVSLGFFSVIRVERPGQFIVSAGDYCVPDKECVLSDDEDPCRVFERMAFPVAEFCPPTLGEIRCSPLPPSPGGCGCKNGS